MSASSSHAEQVFKVALLCGLFSCSGEFYAADEEVPDLEFLEYLGSWDGSDEDWVLLADADVEDSAADDDRDGPVPQGNKVAEVEDEN